MPPSDRFVAETRFHVRYAETDAMGIVHHASYIVYFEEGRSAYARARGSSYAEFEATGVALAVIEVNARYLRPMRYDQVVVLRTWLEEIRSRGLTFAYEITEEASGIVCVSGQTRHVCINGEGRASMLPEQWRKWTLT